MYQISSAATASPTCSFVAIAAAARRANAHSRPWSRCHQARSSGHASATGWKSLTVSHCTGSREEVGDCERRCWRGRAEVLAGEPEDRQRPRGDGERLDDEQQLRVGPEPPEWREHGEHRVEVRAEPGICSPWTLVTESRSPRCGRPDRLRHVAEVEAAALEGPVRSTAVAPKPPANVAAATQTTTAGVTARPAARRDRASARRAPPRSPARGRRRGRLQRSCGRAPDRCARRCTAAASASGSPAGTSSALSPSRSSSRAAEFGRHERRSHASAWNTLFGITRPVFADSPRRRGHSRPPVLVWQQLVVDPVDPLDVRRTRQQERRRAGRCRRYGRGSRARACGGEDRLEPVQRDQLADEECVESSAGCATPGLEEPLLRARRSRPRGAPRPAAEFGQVAGVLRGVGDDEVGATEREPVDQRITCGRGARPEAASVLDERLVQRDERVEEDGRSPAIRRAAGRSRWPG